MPVKRTLNAYNEEKHNCAQSILRGFQEQMNVSEEQIAEAKKHGGGKAEDGLCGALHSALNLTDDTSVKEELSAEFIAKAGSDKCREIRRNGKLSCEDCVRLAATILHKGQMKQ